MATIDIAGYNEALDSNFLFCEDPIVVTVIPKQFSEGSTFRQIIVEVHVDNTNDPNIHDRTHTFTLSAEGNEIPVVADISSAVRSVLAQHTYDAEAIVKGGTVDYPYVNIVVKSWEREMTEDFGVVDRAHTTLPSAEGKTVSVYMGRVGEYERWKYSDAHPIYMGNKLIGPSGKEITFTTKPSGEIFTKGQLCCTSHYNGISVSTSVAEFVGYTDSRKRKVFLFVNSFGVFETVSVLTRESKSIPVSSSRHPLSQSPSYTPRPSITAYKHGGVPVWNMSSGYVNREWAEWFASEFLMARHYWMLYDGKWLPVVVEPDSDTVLVYDADDPSLLAVNFTVHSAVRVV